MTVRVGIREFTRNPSLMNEYSFVEIEDKKSKTLKGAFVSSEYLQEVKKFIEKKEEEKKAKRMEGIMKYVGTFEIEEKFRDKSYKEIRQMIAEEKYGE